MVVMYNSKGDSMPIPFTQFVNKKPVGVEMETNSKTEELARRLLDGGYRFEMEELLGGMVHMDCSKPGAEGPVALELCENGPPVAVYLERLVKDSYDVVFGGDS
jgi:hypothetical protein